MHNEADFGVCFMGASLGTYEDFIASEFLWSIFVLLRDIECFFVVSLALVKNCS